MRVCGVICEYNPFHNGHAYHLRESKRLTDSAYCVCVMSGCFTQRGEAALFSKWARAEMALRDGADVVLELPTLFAVRDASRFAQGGVALLDALGVVTHLSFGSESGDLARLRAAAHQEVDLTAVRQGLSRGMSLARAQGLAQGVASGAPNDILAVEYLRALTALRSDIEPITLRREGSGYHEDTLSPLASATAVRKDLLGGGDAFGALPPAAYALSRRLMQAGAYHPPGGLDTVLLALLRTASPDALRQSADISEGLENRLLRAAQDATDRASLLAQVKCKRYTWTRLSRVCTQAMLGITRSLAAAHPAPSYARLLGFRREAQPLLAAVREASRIPIITRAAHFRQAGDAAFALDIRAGDLWTLGYHSPSLRTGRTDLTHPMVMI